MTQLTWPINHSLIGRKVLFNGYRYGHEHWNYVPGEIYVVAKDENGRVGPINPNRVSPPVNYNGTFDFTLLAEEGLSIPSTLEVSAAGHVADKPCLEVDDGLNLAVKFKDFTQREAILQNDKYCPAQKYYLSAWMKLLEEALKEFRGEPNYIRATARADEGICGQMGWVGELSYPTDFSPKTSMASFKDNIVVLCPSWSGSYSYPVKGVDGRSAESCHDETSYMWQNEYGKNRINMVMEVISLIQYQWKDEWDTKITPATRSGLVEGVSIVRILGRLWRFTRDDESTSPYFTDIRTQEVQHFSLSSVEKIDLGVEVTETSLDGVVSAARTIQQQIEAVTKELETLEVKNALYATCLQQKYKIKLL